MMPDVLPSAKLEPLSRISPSRFTSLQLCPLREIWAANNKPRLLPLHPAAQLGTAVHKFIELGMCGKIRNEQEMLSSWETACNAVEQQMQNNGLEKHLVPLSLSANNYEVKKVMAFNIVRDFFNNGLGADKTDKSKKQESEVWLETNDGKIGGIIDLIKHTQKGIVIIDYKTGSVIDSLSEHGIIKQEYQQQLKFYAALYFTVYSVWPAGLAIEGLDKQEYDIPFSKEECLGLLQDATKLMGELNELIESGLSCEDFARPSAGTCSFCLYRPACKIYWEQKSSSDEWPADICGRIKEKKILGNGLFKIVVENGGNTIAIRGLSLERHNFLNGEVDNVMFCNLGHDTTPGFFIEKQLTTGYQL